MLLLDKVQNPSTKGQAQWTREEVACLRQNEGIYTLHDLIEVQRWYVSLLASVEPRLACKDQLLYQPGVH